MKWGLMNKSDKKDVSLNDFRTNIFKAFDDFFSIQPTALFESEWLPRVDIEETSKELYINAELPGMEEKDINVTLEKNILKIEGEKKEEVEKKSDERKKYITERKYGCFCRSISLPDNIKAEEIKAKFKKGVLKITIPKAKAIKQKTIEISVH